MEAPSTPPPEGPSQPRDAVEGIAINAPTRGNRRLEALLATASEDDRLCAWWHMQNVFANRLGMSDHSWVHVQVVVNIALRLCRLLCKRGLTCAMIMARIDAEHERRLVPVFRI